ncbi:MAG: ABC transporter permease [Bryobacteraceae bacterium]|nr:ABC transporter permease [Bryobacteraceae bacterium]
MRLRWKRRREDDLDRELRFHIEQQVADYMASGMTETAARRRARLEFGGLEQVKEECRDERRGAWLELLWQDVRMAVRGLGRHRAFTLAALAVLALAIGATTLVFSVVDAIVFRPFPYHAPERLAFVWKQRGQQRFHPFVADYIEWRKRNAVFDDMGAYQFASFDLRGGEWPETVRGLQATRSLFTTLGIEPLLGRLFDEGEEREGKGRVLLLSESFWRTRFQSDPAVIGRTLAVAFHNAPAANYTVIGVLPSAAQSAHPLPVHLWAPFALDAEARRPQGGATVIARLRDSVSVAAAAENMRAVVAAVEAERAGARRSAEAQVLPFHDSLVSPARPLFLALAGAVAFVLLLGCANLGNLMLARAVARQREMTVRAALGASRWRLTRLLLVESVVLALAGGLAGTVLAYAGLQTVRAAIAENVLRANTIALDGRVLAFALVVSLIAALLFGLLPAWRSSKGSTAWARQSRWRSSLVVAQLALGLTLLAGAGLMTNSFVRLVRVDHGLNPRDLLAVETHLPRERYAEAAQRLLTMEAALDRVRALPGVRFAGITDFRPYFGAMGIDFEKATAPGQKMKADRETIAGEYFEAMGTPLLQGRTFRPSDKRVVIVNETAAREFERDGRALGAYLWMEGGGEPRTLYQIVGVVADVRRWGPARKARAAIYVPQPEMTSYLMHLLLRTEPGVDAVTLGPAVRRELARLDPDLSVDKIAAVNVELWQSLAPQRFLTALLGIFAVLALALCVSGVYGVVAYTVRLRQREFGVRMALGSTAGGIQRLVAAGAARVTLAGLLLGMAGALAAGRVLSTLLYEIQPHDFVTLAVVTGILAAAVFFATSVPAREAARRDPAEVLRHE